MIQFPFNVALCIENLHLTDILRAFRGFLVNKAGIYGFQNIKTGEIVYIGSCINLWKRLMQHITGQKSNIILQNAFSKYGLASFRFLVFVFVPLEEHNSKAEGRTSLLSAEQLYLNSFNPRYNILKVAGSSLGYTHTPEALAKMSGENNPMFGKTGENNPMFGRTGADHPIYGNTGESAPNFKKVPANASPVYLYNTDRVLLNSFSSREAAAQFLNVSRITVIRYIKSGKVLNGRYIVTSSSL